MNLNTFCSYFRVVSHIAFFKIYVLSLHSVSYLAASSVGSRASRFVWVML